MTAEEAFGELWGSGEFDCGPNEYDAMVEDSVNALRALSWRIPENRQPENGDVVIAQLESTALNSTYGNKGHRYVYPMFFTSDEGRPKWYENDTAGREIHPAWRVVGWIPMPSPWPVTVNGTQTDPSKTAK